jgi:hypothetical protein
LSKTLVRALISHFDSVFAGPNGDYAAVLEVIDKISDKQALWKPIPNQNSIWQIVEHLIGSKEWQIAMLEHREPPPTVWVEPSGNKAAWQATLVRLKAAHQRLKLTLEKLSDADLLDIPDTKSGITLIELILSSGPAHEAHHSGQIDYIRGMQAIIADE